MTEAAKEQNDSMERDEASTNLATPQFDESAIAAAQPVQPLPAGKRTLNFASIPTWSLLAIGIMTVIALGVTALAQIFAGSGNEPRVETSLPAPPVVIEQTPAPHLPQKLLTTPASGRATERPSDRSLSTDKAGKDDGDDSSKTARDSSKPVARRVGVIYGRSPRIP